MSDSCAPPPGTSEHAPPKPQSSQQAQTLHRHIAHAVLFERQAMRVIALGFAAMRKDRLHRELGFAGLVEYGQQCFDFSPSKTRQLALVGRRLSDLPVLDQALASGQLGWTPESTEKLPVAGAPSAPPQQCPSSFTCRNMLSHRVSAGAAP
jgi:hypothetical protein